MRNVRNLLKTSIAHSPCRLLFLGCAILSLGNGRFEKRDVVESCYPYFHDSRFWIALKMAEVQPPNVSLCNRGLGVSHRRRNSPGSLVGVFQTCLLVLTWNGLIFTCLSPSSHQCWNPYPPASAQMPRMGYPQDGHSPPFTSLARTAKWTRCISFTWHCGQKVLFPSCPGTLPT